jgi:phenylacetate-CoA ligase
LILKAELAGGSTDLAKSVEDNVQSVCKVRGRVEFVPLGSLPNDGKVIDDVRKYS